MMIRTLLFFGSLLMSFVSATSFSSPVVDVSDLANVRGGETLICAMPYPIPIGGCATCFLHGTLTITMPGMPPRNAKVYRRCLSGQGDDKCFQSSSLTTSKCIKTTTRCPNVTFGIYLDAQCVQFYQGYSANCSRNFVKATGGATTGVSCVGMPSGVK
jgi:hypothetical protein